MRSTWVACVVLCCACRTVFSAMDSEPLLVARITGDVVVNFKGIAIFEVTPRPAPINLTVFAHPVPYSGETVLIIWNEMDMPQPGTYEVGPAQAHPAANKGFYALYSAPRPFWKSYVSHKGRVTIRELNANRITGSFRFVAKSYCEHPGMGDCTPSIVRPGAPAVAVEGTFSAVRAKPQSQVPR